jgi:hypothetical protein
LTKFSAGALIKKRNRGRQILQEGGHGYYTSAEPYGYGYEGGIFKRVSWGAVFAGLVVALVITLRQFGMGIGLGAINPAGEPLGMGTGAAIWLGITTLIALFVGGWTTAKLAGSVRG